MSQAEILISEIGAANALVKQYGELSAAKMADLQAAVRAGAMTGDPFRDFTIAFYGKLDPTLEKRYAVLNEKLSGHRGDLFLYHFRVKVPFMHSMRDGTTYRPQTFFCCGILKDDRLAFRMGATPFPECVIPANSYYAESIPEGLMPRLTPAGQEIKKGSFSIPPAHLVEWNFDIVAGDADVRRWFELHRPGLVPDEEAFNRFAERLGRLVLTAPQEDG